MMTDSRDSRGDPRSRDRQSSLPLLGQDLALSIVVPIYNEADNIGPFFERLQKTLVDLGEAYEIVCVDDGSTDASAEQLIAQRNQNQAVKIVRLSRNFGKELALTAGLDRRPRPCMRRRSRRHRCRPTGPTRNHSRIVHKVA